MSDFLRVKGSDCQVRLTTDGVLERTVVDIKSSQVVLKITRKLERYLGRISQSYDDQFEGVEGNLLVHVRSQDILVMFDKIARRAQRQTAALNTKFGYSATIQLPNGQRPKILVPDLSFGDLPISMGGGDQYVETTIDWGSETYRLQLV